MIPVMNTTMAGITPSVFTVTQALVLCGVDDVNLFKCHTPAWRLLYEVFRNDFESYMDKLNLNLTVTLGHTIH